jgi:hypothetical protein
LTHCGLDVGTFRCCRVISPCRARTSNTHTHTHTHKAALCSRPFWATVPPAARPLRAAPRHYRTENLGSWPSQEPRDLCTASAPFRSSNLVVPPPAPATHQPCARRLYAPVQPFCGPRATPSTCPSPTQRYSSSLAVSQPALPR